MSVEPVRADINAAIQRIRLEGCVPTMRSALLLWQQYLVETQPNGLSANDRTEYAQEHKRVTFLLSEIFPPDEDDIEAELLRQHVAQELEVRDG
jgi:hypothetical protein